jgi:hypothetical protein
MLRLCFALFVTLAVRAESVDSAARLKALFSKPPAEYSTLPFFVWNGEVTEQDIDRTLADFRAQHVQGFFIHPRPGMITPYLSARWFELIRYTVDRAKKLGMEAWLYDENSYPSGFAGGHVPAEMPESYNQGQGLVRQKTGPCKLLLERRGDEFVDVTGKGNPGGEHMYCYGIAEARPSGWYGGFTYVDLIKPGVTQKFIDTTMRGYEKVLGRDLGTAVPGIFTDEPNIRPPAGAAIRYTPDLFEQFRKRWGYSLETHLPALFEEVDDWKKVRHNYYELLLELFVERWSKPWYAYTEQHKLTWTGHYWEHAWPNPANGPDNMAMYAWHQTPGIDMLFNQFQEGVNAQFGNVRSVKELASVVNQLGRRRALSETYGGAGWELRFEDMKRLGDWEYALGVNKMNQHLAFQTIAGARKYDYPQSFTYHEPWWGQYHVLADYFARLSLALASGEQVNTILVLEPTSSAWMYAAPKTNPRMEAIGKEFQEFITRLEHGQVEYDLGSENILRDHGSVRGARLTVGKRSYDTVILPPGTESLNRTTVELLEQYKRGGGKLISLAAGPLTVDGAPGGMAVTAGGECPANTDFTGTSGMLFHQRRKLQDGELWFFVNSSLDAKAGAHVKMRGKSVERLDPVTGARSPFPAVSITPLEVVVDLPPAGSLLLLVSKNSGSSARPERVEARRPVEASGPLAVSRLGENAIRIDYCDLKLNGRTEEELYFFQAADKVFKAFGFQAGNPWNTAVQFQTSILDRNRFAPDSGFEATFWFDVAEGMNGRSLRAVVERPALWKVTVNGAAVESCKGEWWLDRAFGVYDIGQHAKAGRNALTIAARPMSVHNELEPVYLIGDFGAEAQAKGFRVVPPAALNTGAWKEQKLPFYAGGVSYARTYTLRQGGKYRVELGKWAGTVAEVKLNGKSVGTIGWQPYEAELGESAAGGTNRVEVVVYGSLKNLLGPHHGKINRGLTGPFSFRGAPAAMPPGAEYDLEPYGLLEEFRVAEVKR